MTKFKLLILIFFLAFQTINAQSNPERAAGDILVQLNPKVNPKALERTFSTQQIEAALHHHRQLHAGANMHVFTFDENAVDANQLLAQVRQSALVASAQFNHKLDYRGVTPNDMRYDEQWALRKIQAPDAWEVTTGGLSANGDTIVVAIMDGGCQLDHEDLVDNLWHNPEEIPNDGIDNDGNNYIDDYMGLRTTAKDDQHEAHPHGTRVAGIVSAKGNNGTGISGVTWDAKLMILSQVSFESEAVEAMFYAYEQRKLYNRTRGEKGAFVVACNYSLGVDGGDCINTFPVWNPTLDSLGTEGLLVIGATADRNWDVDEVGDLPTTCTSDFMVAVTNTNQTDEKVIGAAYGAKSVDLGAPGNGTLTTSPGNSYFPNFGGTSASAPHVAGAIALMYSFPCEGLANDAINQPMTTALLMKEFLLGGVDVVPSMTGTTVSQGRLNVNNSFQLIEGHYGQERGPLNFLTIKPNPVDELLTISVTLPDFEDYDLTLYDMVGKKIERSEIPGRCTSPEMQIQVGFLPPGVYVLMLENPDNFVSTRFVVH